MKISREWLRDFVDLPAGVTAEQLAHELTLKTVEVEEWVDTGDQLAGVVVGRVADVTSLGDKGYLQAVCDVGSDRHVPVVSRAGNLHTGSIVAVALPGARLIPTSSDSNVREVVPALLRGVQSQGVICSAADLRLQRLFPHSPAGAALDLAELERHVGTGLADAICFKDVVFEIDNKSLTNRPDLWGHYGIARELATIFECELKPLPGAALPERVEGLVGHLDEDLCRQLTVVEFTLEGSDVAPLWLRSRLARIGEGTVNLIVDISNYVMFTVGQPTHVYDSDRLALPLSISRSGTSAKLDLLTGESRDLDPASPVIRDSTGPVALAGIMGAADSAVSGSTERFILEVAAFRPEPIRRSSQKLAMRTEASARFEKGIDTARVDSAVNVFLHVLTQIAPTASVSSMQDERLEPTRPARVDLELDFLATRIGQRLEVGKVHRILESLGFEVALDGENVHIIVPTWRSTGDVSLPHDIVEEVARIYGYDNIPVAQLTIGLAPVRELNRRSLDRVMREQLAMRAAMQEVVTYPWVADGMLAATGLSKADTLRFEGAPAPDRDSLRPSLIPNLLAAVVTNVRYSQSFRLFEAGVVFVSDGPYVPYHDIFEPLPKQRPMIAATIVGVDGPSLFREAKGTLDMLRRRCHLTDLHFAKECEAAWADRATRLGLFANGVGVGALGLLATRGRRLTGIEDVHVACFELDLDHLSAYRSRENRYEPVSDLPQSDFDLSVVFADDVSWDQISSTITGEVHELIRRVSFVDEFRGSWVPEGHKSVTVRITLRPGTTTLTAEDIGEVRREVLVVVRERLGGHLRE